MAFIKVGKQWLDDIYAENVVKPNEFKQIVSNLVDKEISPNSPTLLQAIIDIAYNQPEKLLLSTEESQYLIFAEGFRSKSFIIRECSDLLKNPYCQDEVLFIDKKTAWAAEYLVKHAKTGRVLIAKLHAKEI